MNDSDTSAAAANEGDSARRYDCIPLELRVRPQWVVATQSKVPLDPKTGRPADVTNPQTWGTFEQAVQAANGHHHGIGFVIDRNDPYTFIDLDAPTDDAQRARHNKILESFPTYTELSRSGQGVHIIVKGKVPTGTRRDKVELYPHDRYMIMTGKVLKPLPITDQQALLDHLYAEMHPTESGTKLVQIDGHFTDAQLLEMAACAANGDKFDRLCRGEWQDMGYPSQSEADFALMSMLAFYTRDNEQVRRLFRASALGKRDKAQRNDTYIDRSLRKLRSSEGPQVDFSGFKAGAGRGTPMTAAPPPAETAELAAAADQVPVPKASIHIPMSSPPGLMGEIAGYIHDSAVKPLPEVAVAGSIALMAGICGRAYNISDTGLNQYVILLAPTGTGKEAAPAGIDKVFTEARKTVPGIDTFIGPAAFASGQGVLKALQKKPCFVAVIGEFGHTLQRISSPNASSADSTFRQVLLDLYMKSGHGRILKEMVYSDREKNTVPVASPSLTLLGESTPSKFYGGLSTSLVEEGLVPRFLVISTDVEDVSRNPQAGFPPPAELVQKVQQLAYTSLTVQQNHVACEVQVAPEAKKLLGDFEHQCDMSRIAGDRNCDKELWSRAYLKAIKLAGLVAVGVNWQKPVVDAAAAQWAINVIVRGTEQVIARFDAGEYGEGENQFAIEVQRALERWFKKTPGWRLSNKGTKDTVMHDTIVPFAYLRDQLSRRSCFANARMGMHRAVDVAVKDAVACGVLLEVPAAQRIEHGFRARCWAMGRSAG